MMYLFSVVNIFGQKIDNESLRVIHGPYIQNLTERGVTIIWHTNRPAVPAVTIHFDDGRQRNVRNSQDGLINGGGTIHTVRLDGLEPGTEYSYEISSVQILKYQPYRVYFGDTLKVGNYNFTTLDRADEEVRFIVFNDIHENSSLLADFLKSTQASEQDMFFFNGDFIDYLQDPNQIFRGFLDTAVFYFATEKPFYYVRGNHETRGMLVRDFKNYFDFGFTHGPDHFVVLDCGEDKPDNNRYYYGLADFDKYRREELAWLKEHIESDDFLSAEYRIVIIHMPVIRDENLEHGMKFLSDYFGTLLEGAGIDLMICGHTHRTRYYGSDESGFNYPVLVSSNRTFTEVTVGKSGIRAEIKDVNANPMLVKEFR